MIIDRILYVIRSIGLSGVYQAIKYGYLRDQIDKPSGKKALPSAYITPGTIENITQLPSGLQIKFTNTIVEVISLTSNMVRISWSPGNVPINYTIVKTDWQALSPEVFEDDTGIQYQCDQVTINISNTGELRFSDPSGIVFKRDMPPWRSGESWTLSSKLSPREHIYGLGERAARLNLRDGTYRSWNTDAGGNYTHGSDPLYIGTPIYLSINELRNHLVYFENSFESKFKIDGTLEATFTGGMLRYYVITGSLPTIYAELGELVGFPFMPPRWSLGYHQCRWGYRSEEDIRKVVRGFKENNFPISAIHLDIDYMDQFKIFSVDKKRFPSLPKLTDDLGKEDIKVVASINPAIKLDQHNPVYQSGLKEDVFCRLADSKIFKGVSWPGWSVFPDFTNVHTREWWKEQYKILVDQGISGIWHDMNEPASFAAWGEKTFPTKTSHDMDGRGGDHREAHNVYGLLMNQAGYEGLRSAAPKKRPWIFSRSGWAGLQRYAWNWTGDIESSWVALRQTIPSILGLGISGHAFSGVDIGGFSGNPDAELYTRWFQLSAFLPLFRTHSAIGTKPREPWTYGEPTTTIVRKFARLRYELLPYIYSLAWTTTKSGIPPIRPIFWNDPQNHALWAVEDEFMLGDHLLVAPVVHPSQHSRLVVLPAGKWFSFWDDQVYQGPCQVEMVAPLENIPLFIKGGTILPQEANGGFYFHLYPSIDDTSNNEFYFDEGDGYGAFRVDILKITANETGASIAWDSEGEYLFPYAAINYQVHGSRISKISLDGNVITADNPNGFRAGKFHEARLEFEKLSV